MLSYDMSRRGALSRYEYLYRRMQDDILSGSIAAGDRLPSKRRLADGRWASASSRSRTPTRSSSPRGT